MSILKGEFCLNRHEFINSGLNGEVFGGTARGNVVAIKRVLLQNLNPTWQDVSDCLNFVRKMDHLNVVSISDIYDDDDFRYFFSSTKIRKFKKF